MPYWKARELEAIKNLNNAYYPNTEEVVYHYNGHFSRTILEFNSIEEEKNMKRLADCATGFAHGTTGGND
ncbi:hypothetical protein Goarm_009933 [Gossypium armourianum]|uniref:Pectate lyase N-terminal domain-containing protein n=1 Tax=Gossypium armourianum TaxID=34283 RepID=A0A7J9JUE4_9ROSI|nr:hypothetical protein [Gossypium armourianum]